MPITQKEFDLIELGKECPREVAEIMVMALEDLWSHRTGLDVLRELVKKKHKQ